MTVIQIYHPIQPAHTSTPILIPISLFVSTIKDISTIFCIFCIFQLLFKFIICHRGANQSMRLITIVGILVFMCGLGEGFVMSIMKNEKKCFYSSIFAANTILLQFGLPRPNRYDCKVQFTVHSQPLASEPSETLVENYTLLYNTTMHCQNRTPGELTVLKYSQEASTLSIMKYRVCVTSLDDFHSNKTYFQLKIAQKEEISLKAPMPGETYVSSQQFLELQAMSEVIKKRLSWSLESIKEAEQLAKKIDLMLKQEAWLTLKLTQIQIVLLVFYGGFWTYFMRRILLNTNTSPK